MSFKSEVVGARELIQREWLRHIKALETDYYRLIYEDGCAKHIGPRGLCPGVQVVLVDRVAAIVDMLPFWNVRVKLLDGSLETWWRGNLQLVLPREPLPSPSASW